MSYADKITKTVNGFLDRIGTGLRLSKLHVAVAKGKIHTVRELVQAGVDVNGLDVELHTMPLNVAVAARNFRMVEELIRLGADVNLKTPDQITALLTAVVRGNVDIVRLLLDNGADINARVENADSLLYTAAAYNHVEVGQLLIERGLDVNVRSGQDETPLHNAVKAGRTEFVKMLIAKGADINAGSCTRSWLPEPEDALGTNVTPLLLAVAFDFPDVIDVLIKADANVITATSGGYTPLHAATLKGSIKLVNKLLAAGSDVNVQTQSGRTPLALATRKGHLEIVKALLRVEGIKVNPVAGETACTQPLAMAAGKGSLEVVKLLVAKGASVNAPCSDGVTPLTAAIMGPNEKIVKFLIDSGADINGRGLVNTTPLHCMCVSRSPLSLIQLLLDKGADVNARTQDGSTPLLTAAQSGSVEIIKCLIDNGADPNAANYTNVTALHIAAMEGNVKAVKFLVTKMTNVNAALTDSLITPLHYAVIKGHPGIVGMLLKSGANPDAQDVKKRTALHLAAMAKQYEIAELLLKHKAAVNLKEKTEGSTPLFIAVTNKDEKLVRLLLDNGADPNIANNVRALPIFLAVRSGSVELVKALLAKGAYYNVEALLPDYSDTPLRFAQEAGNSKLVSMLELIEELFSSTITNDAHQLECCVKAGAIVNARDATGSTALHHAVSNGSTEAVKMLLKYGADISNATNKGDLPLQLAVAKEDIGVVETLLVHAKSLNFVKYESVINAKTAGNGTTVLHIAAEKNNARIVELLLANGAIYNAKNYSNKTPSQLTTDEAIKRLFSCAENLLQAVKKEDGLEEVTRILEQDSTVINARDADGGGTPLYWSVSKGHTDVADVLLANGADYLLVTNKGTTPLHIAASKGYVKIVQTLVTRVKEDNINRAVDFLDATTVSGTAALHVVSNVEVVRSLLQAGAMYNIRNGKGKTLLELTQNNDVRKLLQITHQLFEDVKKGTSKAIDTLNGLQVEDFKAVTGTRNKQGLTLVQVALAGAHVKIAGKLVEKLKKLR